MDTRDNWGCRCKSRNLGAGGALIAARDQGSPEYAATDISGPFRKTHLSLRWPLPADSGGSRHITALSDIFSARPALRSNNSARVCIFATSHQKGGHWTDDVERSPFPRDLRMGPENRMLWTLSGGERDSRTDSTPLTAVIPAAWPGETTRRWQFSRTWYHICGMDLMPAMRGGTAVCHSELACNLYIRFPNLFICNVPHSSGDGRGVRFFSWYPFSRNYCARALVVASLAQ